VPRHTQPRAARLGQRLNRRQFLVSAGAVAAAGAASVAGLDLADHSLFERALHRVGLTASPDRIFPSSGATERSGSLDSRYMGGHVAWTMSHPEGSAAPTGLVVCLHGHQDSHRFAFDQIHLPDVAASVGLRVAVAAVDGGADSYWHKRADGTDALSMLLLEFIPMVRTMVGDVPQALTGWSMGGYGALLAAERAPSQFGGVATASPAIWLTPGASAPGAFDSPADFYANDVFTHVGALHRMVVALACGTDDPFYGATRHLAASMNFPHQVLFGPGSHDAAYWRSVAADQLRALSSVLA
jgi:alpha-beta hydrolase superfamily lysophospholipase